MPDELKAAQQLLVYTLQLRVRRDHRHRRQIQPAALQPDQHRRGQHDRRRDGPLLRVRRSYKNYTLPLIVGALQQREHPRGWLRWRTDPNGDSSSPTSVADAVVRRRPAERPDRDSGAGKPTPGPARHSLDSVSVGGTTLQTGSTNTISGQPPPTFQLNFTNSGTRHRDNVSCKVTRQRREHLGERPSTTDDSRPDATRARSRSARRRLPGQLHGDGHGPARCPARRTPHNNTLTFPVTFQ